MGNSKITNSPCYLLEEIGLIKGRVPTGQNNLENYKFLKQIKSLYCEDDFMAAVTLL
jgi:hypothetical protein